MRRRPDRSSDFRADGRGRVARCAWWRGWPRHRRAFDVVYATGLGPVAVAGARLARRPVILKFVADPAWERAVREDLSNASFTEFQRARAPAGARVRAMRWLRDWSAASRHRGGHAESAAVARGSRMARARRRRDRTERCPRLGAHGIDRLEQSLAARLRRAPGVGQAGRLGDRRRRRRRRCHPRHRRRRPRA